MFNVVYNVVEKYFVNYVCVVDVNELYVVDGKVKLVFEV